MTQKLLKQKVLMEYMERNMRKWDDNIKMDIKESSFVSKLTSSYNMGQSGIFGKFNDVIVHKNKIFCN